MQPQVTFRGTFPAEPIVHAVWRSADRIRASAPTIECASVEIEVTSARRAKHASYRVIVHLSDVSLDVPQAHVGEGASRDLASAMHEAFAQALLVALPGLPSSRQRDCAAHQPS